VLDNVCILAALINIVRSDLYVGECLSCKIKLLLQ